MPTQSPRFRDRFRASLPPWARDLRDLLGDDDAAATYTASFIAYVSSGAAAEQLLAALIASGPPSTALGALTIPSSSLAPQTLRLPDALLSEPATEPAPNGRVDFALRP